jgi:hypothetical protein
VADVLTPLILDLVAWVAVAPRSYEETLAAWRTLCPRLTVWEDAMERGYLVRGRGDDGLATVELTDAGRRLLANAGRDAAPCALPDA